jgi:hypothetical protein
MAHVDDNANAVHFPDDVSAHPDTTGILGLTVVCGQKRLVIIAQLHDARARPCSTSTRSISSSIGLGFEKPKKIAF